MLVNNWDVIVKHLETRIGDKYDFDVDSWNECIHWDRKGFTYDEDADFVYFNVHNCEYHERIEDKSKKTDKFFITENNKIVRKTQVNTYKLLHKSQVRKTFLQSFVEKMRPISAFFNHRVEKGNLTSGVRLVESQMNQEGSKVS